MLAHAVIEAALDPHTGVSRHVHLRSDPPLTLRATPGAVYLVGSAAAPLGGDDLRLDVVVRAGASLVMRSVAAMLAQPGVTGSPSRLAIDVTVEDGAMLYWLPQPMILVRGCDHETHTTIRLADRAGLVWRDEIVLGRHDEATGSALQRLRVDVGGRPMLRNDLVAGPRWPGSSGPAGLGIGARAVGSVLVVGAPVCSIPAGVEEAPVPPGVRSALLRLEGQAALVTAVAPSAHALRGTLDRVVACAGVPAPDAAVLRPGAPVPGPESAAVALPL